MAYSFDDQALLILGHGSSFNPISSRSTRDAAQIIEKRSLFSSVHCAFWKERPGFRDVWGQIEEREVFVVPHFISEGYFTREVIPRELGLSGAGTTIRENHTIHYCNPLGLHPGMTDLLISTAMRATTHPPEETALILIGHGTEQNATSSDAINDQIEKIRQSGIPFAEVRSAFLDEAPYLSDWNSLTTAPHVIAVPFFIAEGKHSQEDIPRILASEKSDEQTITCTSPIGIDPAIPGMIVDQVIQYRQEQKK